MRNGYKCLLEGRINLHKFVDSLYTELRGAATVTSVSVVTLHPLLEPSIVR